MASWPMRLPTGVDPVNEIRLGMSWSTKGSPISLDGPTTTLRTPGGKPAVNVTAIANMLDLGKSADRQRFDALLDEADVLVAGYRPQALAHLGLDPASLAERRPGLVVATLSAWGPSGPWGGMRGFDSIVQAATGIALAESVDGETPGRLPAQALDHATGYLLAAAVLRAVTLQLRDGGNFHVEAHLARSAHWLLEQPAAHSGELSSSDGVLHERDTPSGLLRYAGPAFRVGESPEDWDTVGGPWGVDPPEWRGAMSAEDRLP